MMSDTPATSRMNISACRLCQSPDLRLYLPLGDQALANSFLTKEQLEENEPRFPLEVFYCGNCFHSQLGYTVSPDQMFRHYLWVSGTSDQIPIHFAEYAKEVYTRFMKKNDLVVEAASNDGTLLGCFREYPVRFLGVEPALNIAEDANAKGINTVPEFFTTETAKKIVAEHGTAAALISNNVFAHVDNLDDFTQAAYTILNDDGVWTIESPHILDFLKKNEFDTVYHEHISYLSLTALVPFFSKHSLQLFDVRQTSVHGGSIRMYVSKNVDTPQSNQLRALLKEERDAGISNPHTYEEFGSRIVQLREKLLSVLNDLKQQGRTIAGYGASAKGQTLLQYCEIGTDLLEYVADKAPLKQGRYTPGTHIPIVPAEAINDQPPEYLLILAWNFAEEIMKQQQVFAERGGKFIIPIPEPRIV